MANQLIDELSFANILRSRNKFDDANVIYDNLLKIDGSNIEVLIGKGTCLQMQGKIHKDKAASENLSTNDSETFFKAANDCFLKAISLDPNNARAHTQYGLLYKEAGKLESAAEHFEKARLADTSYKQAAECLAIVLTDQGTKLMCEGKTKDGIKKYEEASKIDPHYAPALYCLGVEYQKKMEYEEALIYYKKAASEMPNFPESYCNMGVIHKIKGDWEIAISYYKRCLAVSPNFKLAKNNMAIALTVLGAKVEGDVCKAVAYYNEALYWKWDYALAMYNLGASYYDMLQFNMAIRYFELAYHFNPQCFKSCHNLGLLYQDRDELDKAVEYYLIALSINTKCAQTLNQLGIVYTAQGKFESAYSLLTDVTIRDTTEALNNLGLLFRDAGYLDDAISNFKKCLQTDSNSLSASQNLLHAKNYNNEGPDDTLFEDHREWGSHFSKLYPPYTSWDNLKDPDRPITIGYISPDFFTHSVSHFIEAPLMHHDYKNYNVVVYSLEFKADAFKDKVVKNGGQWRDIYHINEKKIADMIREDKIDILVGITGHTVKKMLETLAYRPAPVQVSWIGYPSTTGLPTVDYRITDWFADPLDTKQKHVEELVRLPNCFLCYTPSPEAVPVCPLPASSNRFVTFGSFNNLAKITSKVLQVWAKILSRVPYSRMAVICKSFSCDKFRENYLKKVVGEGLESKFVDLIPLEDDHMKAYSLMDISLDTFPYAGTTTTCESLYMGVPCVTVAGLVHAQNVGASLLTNVGLGYIVAKSEEEYVNISVNLASDIKSLSELRMKLRDQMANSHVCNGSSFTAALESEYRNVWGKYCGKM